MHYIFRLEKLVRDRIPELMSEPGNVLEVLTLDHKAHIHALKEKLKEEVEEVLNAHTREQVIEEIADVAEVLDALTLKLSIKKSEIEDKKRAKAMRKGGFDRGLFVKTVQLPSDSDLALRFLQEPGKYPRLEEV
ncbi:MAG TPA: hypothetical protein VEK06_00330 [Myxococcota bacterium]|nr:hypothetical protein [Myxococcota bacterium]